MIRVQIGTNERTDAEITEQWISEQIRLRLKAGEPVCIRVSIQSSSLNLTLATFGCASTGGGGGRAPNPDEREVFELWDKRGLNRSEIHAGELIAFLAQVRRTF